MKTDEVRLGAITLVLLMILSIGIAYTASKTSSQFAFAQLEDATESKNVFLKSDNTILHLPIDEEKWLPIVPPEPVGRPLYEYAEQDIELVIYDVKTKETKRVLKYFTKPEKTTLKLPGSQGSLSSELIPESPIGYGDRVRVTPTTGYPWRTICKLRIWFPSGQGTATGFIIDDYHVLTAGHCVYDPTLDEWATFIEVIPALDGGYDPFYHALATNWVVNSNWYNNGWYTDDFAIITLDRNIGDYTGWMGLYTSYPSDPIYTSILNTAGYPGDLDYGWNMYFDSDLGEGANEYNHGYWMDTRPGQSGSPVWYYDGTDHDVLSIVAYETPPEYENFGTRLSEYWFDMITYVRDGDISPIDYANLIDDGQDLSGFGPVTVTPGVSNFEVWSDIRNIGTADSGIFFVSYYASTDTEITTSDYLIGIDVVTPITPFTWTDSDWSGTFPNIPAGTYYVGWIIDSTDVVPEPLDEGEGNNVAYKESYQLNVLELNLSPIADAGGPYSAEEGVAISFDGSGSTDPDGTIDFYAWDFGDRVDGIGVSPSHAYTAAGNYTVNLLVTDDDGALDSDTSYVVVSEIVDLTGFSIDYVSSYVVDYGHVLTVMGSNATSGSTVNVYWDFVTAAYLLNTTEGLTGGEFECEVTVPSAVYGDHYLWAKDLATGLTTRSDAIFVVPKVTLSKYWGVPGEDITISGYGFYEDEDVILTLGSVHIGNFTTNNLGGFSGKFTVPALDFEVYKLIAEQPSHEINVEIDFKIGFVIGIISPSSGEPGTIITLMGIGFTPDGMFEAIFSGPIGGDTVSEIVFWGGISTEGTIELELIFPFSNAGKYDITVLDIETGIFIKLEFEVLSGGPPLPPILSNLSITPDEVELGDKVTISFDIENIDSQSFTYAVDIHIGELTLLVDVELGAYESETVQHTITPDAAGSYNVTVDGLTGSFTVLAREPIINPLPGQYANYTLYLRNETVDRAYGWCNVIYQSYVTPILVNVSVEEQINDMYSEWWFLVNVMNRIMFEGTNVTWSFWIETDIKLDDEIILESFLAKVVGSGIIDVAGLTREYWLLESDPYLNMTFLWGFDKETGILIYFRNFNELGESNFTLTSTNIFSSMCTREIALFEGWNLIGLPCMPEDPSIEVVLSEIIDYVESVWAFDGETKTWSCYSLGAPSDLTVMVDDKGYWINVNMDVILTIYCDSE